MSETVGLLHDSAIAESFGSSYSTAAAGDPWPTGQHHSPSGYLGVSGSAMPIRGAKSEPCGRNCRRVVPIRCMRAWGLAGIRGNAGQDDRNLFLEVIAMRDGNDRLAVPTWPNTSVQKKIEHS